jgi:hypothetical protein
MSLKIWSRCGVVISAERSGAVPGRNTRCYCQRTVTRYGGKNTSYTIAVKFPGDLGTFQKALADRSEELKALADKGRSLGAVHHRFAVGGGYLVVVDEWESPDSFQAFVGDPDFQAFTTSVGASGAPEVWIGESISSPDEY